MRIARNSMIALAALLTLVLWIPETWAACQTCTGSFGSRYCKDDPYDGQEGCRTDYYGNCINGTTSCSGGSCGEGTGCEEETKGDLDWLLPAEGEVLPAPLPTCELPGLVVEA